MIEIKFDAAQLEAIENEMKELVQKVAKKTLRQAVRKGMKIVKDDARDHAPKETGLLDENFALMTKTGDGVVIAKIGIRGGAKAPQDDKELKKAGDRTIPWYWRLAELGTKHEQARPFMRPALENNAQFVFDAVVAELEKALIEK